MNRTEFLAALRQALSGLPDEERASALRYYEEYFDDAGPENEIEAAKGLGSPDDVAKQILADYRELVTHPHSAGASGTSDAPHATSAQAPPRWAWRGINPWLLLIIAIFAIPIGVPLFIGLLAVLAGVVITVLALLLGILIILIVVPLALFVSGIVLAIISFFLLWGSPASACVTFGVGLMATALGVLTAALCLKLFQLFVPPICRGLVALLRWPFKLFERSKS